MKILNLYCGVGGNRKLWSDNHDITAVEIDPKIAAVYKKLYVKDDVIIGDAHEFLRLNYSKFDFIWSSPPCPTHSKMAKATRHKNKKFPDMKLYEEILFLNNFFKGGYVVENVISYYEPLIKPQKIGRHYYWSNFNVDHVSEKTPKGFVNLTNLDGKKKLMNWLNIHFDEKIYCNGNHCPSQVLRNCVHPKEGLAILENFEIERMMQ